MGITLGKVTQLVFEEMQVFLDSTGFQSRAPVSSQFLFRETSLLALRKLEEKEKENISTGGTLVNNSLEGKARKQHCFSGSGIFLALGNSQKPDKDLENPKILLIPRTFGYMKVRNTLW